jgi:DNA mismatch repair protein MutS2
LRISATSIDYESPQYFLGHVLAIKSMLESATERSLILLDEIGSSTEPGEGAALARRFWIDSDKSVFSPSQRRTTTA